MIPMKNITPLHTKSERSPDFFFVGHPRSGSGLLDSFLQGHPDIFMARKELHYFGSDLHYHTPARTRESYMSHFASARSEKRVGEASTWYLASQKAADEIKTFAPEARIIMMLRNPVTWLHSLHSHLIFSGDEDIADFGAALEADSDRFAGNRVPDGSLPGCALHYRHLVRYAEQVERYFSAFGRDRVHVMILDDFKVDAATEYRKCLEFLGLPTVFPGMDEVLHGSARSKNSNRTVRSTRVRSFIRKPSQWRVLVGLDPAPVPGWGLAVRALRRINIEYTDRQKMDPDVRARLNQELRPRVDDLEQLLGRSLPNWCS